MKSMTDILTWVIGLIATGLAVYFFFWKYKTDAHPDGDPKYLWMAIGCTVVAFLCALVFFVRRVNKEEELSGLDLSAHGVPAYPEFLADPAPKQKEKYKVQMFQIHKRKQSGIMLSVSECAPNC